MALLCVCASRVSCSRLINHSLSFYVSGMDADSVLNFNYGSCVCLKYIHLKPPQEFKGNKM